MDGDNVNINIGVSNAPGTDCFNFKDITQHEIEALKTEYNLADAHTHQSQSVSQKRIVGQLDKLWYRAERLTQYQSEQEFIEKFYTLHGQHTALKRKDEIYLVYAASIAMHITATYLMQHGLRVGLVEPCFDNLHDLMKHMHVPLEPIDESVFYETSAIYENLMHNALHLDVIFLVDPNNPTGFSLLANDHVDGFLEVVRFCKEHNKLLILDMCFSAFVLASEGRRYDIYEVLERSGVRYIVMEDTGKTWPIQDAKCATLMASRDINEDVYDILTSVLLNVSPFILNILSSYIDDSKHDGFWSVTSLLEGNRNLAIEYLDGNVLRYCEPMVNTSVAWFEIMDLSIDAEMLQKILLAKNVYVLEGKYFFWANPNKGQRYIRIALARDTELFIDAMKVMRDALNEIN